MTRIRPRSLAFLSASMLVAASGLAQEAPDDLVLEIRAAGLADIEPHEKDAAAHRALMMLGDRLAEVPGEFDGPEEAREAIELVWAWLSGGTGVRVSQSDRAPGMSLAISMQPYGMDAEEFGQRVTSLLEQSGAPIGADGDGSYFSTPLGRARLDAGEHDAMTLMLGTEEAAGVEVSRLDLPGGADAHLSGRLHLERLGQFVRQIVREEEPRLSELIEENAWIVDEAPLVDFAMGADGEHQHAVSRLHDAKSWVERMGVDTTVTFTPEDLSVVPRDAVMVQASPIPMDVLLNVIDFAIEESGEDPFEMIEEQTGYDIRGDVLENIGSTMIYYQSLTTGGGGFFSGVLIVDLEDAERAGEVHAQLRDQLNELGSQMARGYVRIRAFEAAGEDVFALATPGMPLPIEPSWGIVDDRLVVSASPVGLTAAIEQMQGGEASVMDSAVFGGGLEEVFGRGAVSALRLNDTAFGAEEGYAGASMLTSALSNAVRSPQMAQREAGTLIPPYTEFVDDIRPAVSAGYWEGDDYVVRMQADGSMLVHTAEAVSKMGFNWYSMMGAVQALGAQAGNSLSMARADAMESQSAAYVRGLIQAALIYSAEHDGAHPESYEDLLEPGLISEASLASPFGPAFDDGGDIVMRFDLDDGALTSYQSGLVVAIDRAAYMNGGGDVAVGFADGHVQIMGHWEVEEVLDQPVNEGAREALNLD